MTNRRERRSDLALLNMFGGDGIDLEMWWTKTPTKEQWNRMVTMLVALGEVVPADEVAVSKQATGAP